MPFNQVRIWTETLRYRQGVTQTPLPRLECLYTCLDIVKRSLDFLLSGPLTNVAALPFFTYIHMGPVHHLPLLPFSLRVHRI